eukprot:COSAG01_NODE_5744_length_4062_cov_8.080242_1_plen_66_part_00
MPRRGGRRALHHNAVAGRRMDRKDTPPGGAGRGAVFKSGIPGSGIPPMVVVVVAASARSSQPSTS